MTKHKEWKIQSISGERMNEETKHFALSTITYAWMARLLFVQILPSCTAIHTSMTTLMHICSRERIRQHVRRRRGRREARVGLVTLFTDEFHVLWNAFVVFSLLLFQRVPCVPYNTNTNITDSALPHFSNISCSLDVSRSLGDCVAPFL